MLDRQLLELVGSVIEEELGISNESLIKLDAIYKEIEQRIIQGDQKTTSNIDYEASPKLPKIKDSELLKCIKNIQVAIEKLGNFT